MKKVILVFILFGACSLFTSCNLDDDGQNFHFTTLDIIEATVPESFDLNETYTIEVTYLRPNSCTFFEGFDFSKPAETDRDIVAIGSVLTDDTACTQATEEVVATFEFNVIFTEDYHFRFFSGMDENDDATYIEYTIPVNVPN
ncbi:hypothetical protein [Flagellimonas eckloniae]|uniref:Lipoprotein n=1 Tax=Flagellimonas eckloniae TaxID=346185 RepID=A0A0Q1BIV8_9FLAO|nr:hypothetical protein [Allomuricauda eckloniae]KQC30550.1 hypothetical protein AAY42_12215 [Allomuricauda eckloniae]